MLSERPGEIKLCWKIWKKERGADVESKWVIERGLHRQKEVEKVMDSRMKIAIPVLGKAK